MYNRSAAHAAASSLLAVASCASASEASSASATCSSSRRPGHRAHGLPARRDTSGVAAWTPELRAAAQVMRPGVGARRRVSLQRRGWATRAALARARARAPGVGGHAKVRHQPRRVAGVWRHRVASEVIEDHDVAGAHGHLHGGLRRLTGQLLGAGQRLHAAIAQVRCQLRGGAHVREAVVRPRPCH